VFAVKWLSVLCGVTCGLAAAPSNPQVESQLKALFGKWDLDGDGFLDKEELAKHFRGPNAKPPAEGMYDNKGHLTRTYYQAQSKYPDLVFLWTVDKDADGRISWMEFEQYGQAYAAAQQQLLQNLRNQAARNLRNAVHRQTNYVRHANRSHARQSHSVAHYNRNVSHSHGGGSSGYGNYNSNLLAMQRQMYQMAVARRQEWIRMYQAQVRNQMRMYENYVRNRAAIVRAMQQRHFNSTYQRFWHR
jgi:hypothetical protein